MAGARWNVANIISLARVPLAVPAAYLLWRGEHKYIALGFLAAATFTDLLDGVIARARGQITDFGKKIDPLADKVVILGVGVILVLKYGVPWWLFAAAAARDVAIVVSAWMIIKKRRVVVGSEFWGKAAAAAMVVYAVAVILAPASTIITTLTAAVVGLLIISSASYGATFIRALHGGPTAHR